MYEAYFTKRLLEALTLADGAADAGERCVHLKASRYYRDLLQFPEKRDSTRHPIRLRATIRRGAEFHRVTLSDLSTGGFRMTLDERLSSGASLTIQIDGFEPIPALVVWQDGDQTGCRFANELHPALVEAAIDGRLHEVQAQWDPRPSLGVVMAARPYPDAPVTGEVISGLDAVPGDIENGGAKVFHAGTALDAQGNVLSAGGRVLCVTALGDSVAQAQQRAHAGVDAIGWASGFHRRDIGWRAIAREQGR